MLQTAGHLTQGVGPPAQGAGPPALAQGAEPPSQGAGPPAQGAGPPAPGARPPVQGAGPPVQGTGPPMQGVRPLVPTTIPQLYGQAPGDPKPVQLKDPGLGYVSCVCPIGSSYNNCMESVSCHAASKKRDIVNAVHASSERLIKLYYG